LTQRVREQAGIVCALHSPQPIIVQDALTATHLFHIAQEATNNALRHGRATRIDIHLAAKADALVLSIRDDGVGLEQELSAHDGIGLRLMRYRASLVGGALQIGPAEKKGTVVTCTVPAFASRKTACSAPPERNGVAARAAHRSKPHGRRGPDASNS
jgi:signal transduction histidine kinase